MHHLVDTANKEIRVMEMNMYFFYFTGFHLIMVVRRLSFGHPGVCHSECSLVRAPVCTLMGFIDLNNIRGCVDVTKAEIT